MTLAATRLPRPAAVDSLHITITTDPEHDGSWIITSAALPGWVAYARHPLQIGVAVRDAMTGARARVRYLARVRANLPSDREAFLCAACPDVFIRLRVRGVKPHLCPDCRRGDDNPDHDTLVVEAPRPAAQQLVCADCERTWTRPANAPGPRPRICPSCRFGSAP